MKFDRIKSILGRRLLTVLMVPAILGCNFTAVQTSANEAAAVAGTEENGETADKNSDEQQNNDNGSDNGEAAPQDNADGSGEGAGEQGGQDGSEAEDASSTGASTDEGDNTGSGEGASTGASSETAGSDSSTDATSGSSSDAAGSATSGNSDASGSASSGASDASTDASSGASSEDSAEAASSASSEEWKDEDVSENSDVSGNDAEDEAEFFATGEDVFSDNLAVQITHNTKRGEAKSTDVCFVKNCIALRDWVISGVSTVEITSPSELEEKKKSGEISNDFSSHFDNLIYHIFGEVSSNSIYLVATRSETDSETNKSKIVEVVSYSPESENIDIFEKGDFESGIQGYSVYAYTKNKTCEYVEDINNTYYVNPQNVDVSKFLYSISNVSFFDFYNNSINVKSKANALDPGTELVVTKVLDADKKVILDNSDPDPSNWTGYTRTPSPIEPLTYLYRVIPLKSNTMLFLEDAMNNNVSFTLPYQIEADQKRIYSDTESEAYRSTNTLVLDNKNPKASSSVNSNSWKYEEVMGCQKVEKDWSVDFTVYDETLNSFDKVHYIYTGNDEEKIGDIDINATADKDEHTGWRPKTLSVSTNDIENEDIKQLFDQPGVFVFDQVFASDYAGNDNVEYTPVRVIYDPIEPKLTVNKSISLNYKDDKDKNIRVHANDSSVSIGVSLHGGLFPTRDYAKNCIKNSVKIIREVSAGVTEEIPYEFAEFHYDKEKSEYSGNISVDGEGKYTVSVTSGGQKDYGGLTVSAEGGEVFIIRPAVPTWEKKTIKKDKPENGMYYKKSVIEAVIFDQPDQDNYIKIKNVDAGMPTKLPKLTKETVGDTTVAKAIMEEDGRYCFEIYYERDGQKYDGAVFDTYVIDGSKPHIFFDKVQNFSANNGEVAPVIQITDDNLDVDFYELKLTGSNKGDIAVKPVMKPGTIEIQLSCPDFVRYKEVDDLYQLEAKARDKAGNEETKTLVFSVNRFGSIFVLGDATKVMNEMYYINDPQDVIITEINVDDLIARDISVTRDGSFRKLNNETDYRVSRQGDDTTWKTYTYNVSRNNFDKDGVYSVSLYTKDRATNEMDNKSRDAEIEFAVDRTAPSIVAADIEDKGVYKEKKHEFNVDVTDNMGVVSLTVYNNGKTVQEYTGEQLKADNNIETITLKEGKKPQNITLVALDVAGNKQTVVFKDIVVSAKDAEKIAEEEVEEVEETEAEVIDIPETLGVAKGPEQPVKPEKPQEQLKPVKPEIPVKPGFPYKKAAAAAGAGACVLAAAGAGIIIRRRRKIK